MTEDITKDLKQDEPSEFHAQMLTECLRLVKMSRSVMSKNYPTWDINDQVFRGERNPDEDDVKQDQKGKPIKMVVPNTFAQCMTFTSFLFLLYNQNDSFYSLIPTGNEDHGSKHEDCETVLEHNARANQWNTLLFQLLVNLTRFGPAIVDTSWCRKIINAKVETPSVATYQSVSVEYAKGTKWQQFVKYEGNEVSIVSPYRFFPDTRWPISEFQKGEFCAAEEEYSKVQLQELENAGEVAGVDKIQPMGSNWVTERGAETRTQVQMDSNRSLLGYQKDDTYIVTKLQRWIIPNKYKTGPGDDDVLGPEDFKILYHVWYANDNRVIRCEPALWWHNEFSWSVAEFTPDMHHTINHGLADLIYRLQDVISWLINARITDVRRNLRGRHIVDPVGIEVSSLNGDGDIYLRKSASKSDVRRWITPLQTQDVTASHMQDAELIGKIVEVVTGVNNNAMGQYNTGRRSAQESRVVTAGAAGRMKMHGQLIWDMCLGQVGRKMLSNNRQSLSFEMFARICGKNEPDIQQRYQVFQGDPEEIICSDDYFVFDSTLSSEKGFMAQQLQELLAVIMQSDPTAAARLAQGVDPVKIVEESLYLRGGGDIKRFRYTPQEQQQILQMQQQRADNEAAANKPKVAFSIAGKLTDTQEEAIVNQTLGAQIPRSNIQGEDGSTGQTNGNGSTAHIDRSTHVTIQKPNARK